MFFPIRLALCSAFVLSASNLCYAQPISPVAGQGSTTTPPVSASKAPISTDKTTPVFSLVYSDVDVKKLLSELASQLNISMVIAGDVEGKIGFIEMQDKTPRQVVDAICHVANLKVQEVEDGILIISKK